RTRQARSPAIRCPCASRSRTRPETATVETPGLHAASAAPRHGHLADECGGGGADDANARAEVSWRATLSSLQPVLIGALAYEERMCDGKDECGGRGRVARSGGGGRQDRVRSSAGADAPRGPQAGLRPAPG